MNVLFWGKLLDLSEDEVALNLAQRMKKVSDWEQGNSFWLDWLGELAVSDAIPENASSA